MPGIRSSLAAAADCNYQLNLREPMPLPRRVRLELKGFTEIIPVEPRRLRLARELKGWTKQHLAESVGVVSAAAISQYENGTSRPGPQVLAQLALTLGMPKAFFDVGRPIAIAESGVAHMRSLRSTTLSERRRALGHASLAWELVALLENYLTLPRVDLPHAVLPDTAVNADIEALASEARSWFAIPEGQPVPNVVRLLESRGVVVVRLPVESEHVDAFCVQLEGRPVVVLSSDKDDKARSRFDAAHELAHLVLHIHGASGRRDVERDADQFASAFLIPRGDLISYMPKVSSLSQLIRLKDRWGVSVSALA